MTPLPWRRVVATWSAPIREWWGRRANELQDEGLDWDEAERMVFLENHGSMDLAESMPATADDGIIPAWIDDPSSLFTLAEARDLAGGTS